MSILSTTKLGKSNYITVYGANQFIEKASEQVYEEVFTHDWQEIGTVMRFKFDFHLNMNFKKQYNDLFNESVLVCKDDGLSLHCRVYRGEFELLCKKNKDEVIKIIQNSLTRNFISKIYNHIEYSKHEIEPSIVSLNDTRVWLIDTSISGCEHRKEDIFRKDMFIKKY